MSKVIKTYFKLNGYIFTANLLAFQLVPPSAIHNNRATLGRLLREWQKAGGRGTTVYQK